MNDPPGLLQSASRWWTTDVIDIKPGVIRIRGYPIEQLIGAISFPQMIWLMLRGELPSTEQGALLEAALVSAVDHGPQAPSIALKSITNDIWRSAANLTARSRVHGWRDCPNQEFCRGCRQFHR